MWGLMHAEVFDQHKVACEVVRLTVYQVTAVRGNAYSKSVMVDCHRYRSGLTGSEVQEADESEAARVWRRGVIEAFVCHSDVGRQVRRSGDPDWLAALHRDAKDLLRIPLREV